MIKDYNPKPFEQFNSLPAYVAISEQYELLAKTKTGYVINLAKLTIGKSLSAGNQLTHVLFGSFSDHGERRAVARTRVSGNERVFSAVMNAMMEVGTKFAFVTWIQTRKPDIEHYEIVSQSCH